MPTVTGIATEFITFTRASNATVTDSDGKVKWAPHNLLTNSESFDAASWTKNISLIAANSIAAPNGTTTADKLYPSTSGTKSGVLARPTAVEEQYTLSVYAKSGGKNFITFTDFSAGSARAWANLSTGAKTETAGYFLTVTNAGSGWWRCDFTQTAKVASPYAFFIVCDADSSDAVTVNGTDGIYIWGASLYRSDLAMQPNTSAYPMYNPTTPKNLLGYTQDFNNAYWLKYAVAVPATKYADPFGGTTANLLYPTAATTDACLYKGGFPSVSKTHSYYVKSAGKSWVCILKEGTTGGAAWFNLSTGSVGTVAAGYTAPTPVSLGNGWYRCSVTSTSGFSQYTAISAVDADNSTTPTPNGTDGIYLWGAQLSDSASLDPYVPVYGAAVTSAAYYGPRRDFDPVTLACKGLLVEEQRSNLIRYSRTLETTGSYWGGLASGTANTITIDNAPGPDGLSTSASMITYNTAVTGAGTYSAWRHTLSTTANGTYTFTIWLKAGTTSSVYLRFSDSGGNRANTLCTLTSSWQRFTVTGTTAASITTISCDVGADGNAGGQTLTAGTVYAYGAQLELGGFATSYVPNGSAVAGATRNADVASVSTQAFPYSSTEGTLVVAWQLAQLSGSPAAIHLTDAAESNRIRINAHLSGLNRSTITAAGALVDNIDTSTAATGITKYAIGGKSADYAVYRNGSAGGTSTNAGFPSGCTEMRIGRDAATGNFNGHIRQITYIPRRLANAELQTRTS